MAANNKNNNMLCLFSTSSVNGAAAAPRSSSKPKHQHPHTLNTSGPTKVCGLSPDHTDSPNRRPSYNKAVKEYDSDSEDLIPGWGVGHG